MKANDNSNNDDNVNKKKESKNKIKDKNMLEFINSFCFVTDFVIGSVQRFIQLNSDNFDKKKYIV